MTKREDRDSPQGAGEWGTGTHPLLAASAALHRALDSDLEDGALLCAHHHHGAHDPTYGARWRGDGAVTFHRRC